MVFASSSNVVGQPVNDGLELSKRLIYRTAMEQLEVIFAAHGATSKEDQLFKMLAEIYAESQNRAFDYGYCTMK